MIAIINAIEGIPTRAAMKRFAALTVVTLMRRLRTRKYPHHRFISYSKCCIYVLILHYQSLEIT
jgi:hypothetical protein